MCCKALTPIRDGDREYRFGHDKAADVFNAQYLREVRKGLLEGKRVDRVASAGARRTLVWAATEAVLLLNCSALRG